MLRRQGFGPWRAYQLNGIDLAKWTVQDKFTDELEVSPGLAVVPAVGGVGEVVTSTNDAISERQVSIPLAPGAGDIQGFERLLDELRQLVYAHNLVLRRVRANPAGRGEHVTEAGVVLKSLVANETGYLGRAARFTLTLVLPGVWFRDLKPTAQWVRPGEKRPLTRLSHGTAPIRDAIVLLPGPVAKTEVRDCQSGSGFIWQGTCVEGESLRVKPGDAKAHVVDGAGRVKRDVSGGLYGVPEGWLRLCGNKTGIIGVDIKVEGGTSETQVGFEARRCWQ